MNKYESLNEEEKTIINVFTNLLELTGNLKVNVDLFPENISEDKIIVDKKEDKWISYIKERGIITGYMEFDDAYSMCLNVFESLDKESTDYCMNMFVPAVVNLSNKVKNKTRK